jgi:hypothetical protein
MLIVDRFEPQGGNARFDPKLHVPAIKGTEHVPKMLTSQNVNRTFPGGRICHAQSMSPTAHVLVPGLRDDTFLVLNRDPNIAELACFEHKWRTR